MIWLSLPAFDTTNNFSLDYFFNQVREWWRKDENFFKVIEPIIWHARQFTVFVPFTHLLGACSCCTYIVNQ